MWRRRDGDKGGVVSESLALGFALVLERESPSLHPFPESRVGGWLLRWCVSCVLMLQLPREPVLASEQLRVSALRQLGHSRWQRGLEIP